MNKGCDAPCPPDQKGTINSNGHQVLMRLQAHFLAADFAAPRVVAVCSSVAEFQALAIRFTANMLYQIIERDWSRHQDRGCGST